MFEKVPVSVKPKPQEIVDDDDIESEHCEESDDTSSETSSTHMSESSNESDTDVESKHESFGSEPESDTDEQIVIYDKGPVRVIEHVSIKVPTTAKIEVTRALTENNTCLHGNYNYAEIVAEMCADGTYELADRCVEMLMATGITCPQASKVLRERYGEVSCLLKPFEGDGVCSHCLAHPLCFSRPFNGTSFMEVILDNTEFGYEGTEYVSQQFNIITQYACAALCGNENILKGHTPSVDVLVNALLYAIAANRIDSLAYMYNYICMHANETLFPLMSYIYWDPSETRTLDMKRCVDYMIAAADVESVEFARSYYVNLHMSMPPTQRFLDIMERFGSCGTYEQFVTAIN
jgi:hypothetical protein